MSICKENLRQIKKYLPKDHEVILILNYKYDGVKVITRRQDGTIVEFVWHHFLDAVYHEVSHYNESDLDYFKTLK